MNRGHAKTANSIDIDDTTGNVLSVADDGKLIIHDIEHGYVIEQKQLSSMYIKKIVKHPSDSIIAVFETDNLHTYQISVWDISKWQKLYTYSVSETPLYMDFSPKGTYIVYTTTEWNSIHFLETKTGEIKPLISEGFGIIPSLFISSSEKTVVAYGPSGKIFYVDVKTGRQKENTPIATVNNLQNVLFHQKGRFLFGTKDSDLYIVDLVNGSIVERRAVGEIQHFSLYDDSLYAYVKNNNYYYIQKFNLTENRLIETVSNDRNIPFSYDILASSSHIILTGIEGNIYIYDTGNLHNVSYDPLVPVSVSNVMFHNDQLYCLFDRTILIFSSDFSDVQTFFPDRRIEGFHIQDNHLLFWDDSFTLFSYDLVSENLIQLLSLSEPVKAATSFGDRFAVLENSGTLHVVSVSGDIEPRRYPTKELNAIIMPDESTILGGRNIGGSFNTSLIQINAQTGEIIGLDNKNMMIVDMSCNTSTGSIYTLGVQERRGIQYTVISEILKNDYTNSSPIATFKGIDTTISYISDPISSRFFIFTGTQGLQMYSWEGFTVLQKGSHLATELFLSTDYVLTLNNNYSLSFWNKKSGNFLFDLYIADPTHYVMTFSDGTFYSNQGLSPYIKYFNEKNTNLNNTAGFLRSAPF
ncbi:MAG: hypothetical protein JXB03_13000 [Spirochaetales bacterium]|nr:hypothetical protein [Spirochaetales bacterium]